MQDKFKVALIQSDLVWENPASNRDSFTNQLESIDEQVDLIVLPEMFSSGFTMKPENVYEDMDGPTVKWMRTISARKNAAITGSLVIKEDGKFYNRMIFMKPDGTHSQYDKRHTFTLAGEHEIYERGVERTIAEFRGWTFCLQVCYDLRFPVWARNTNDYDAVVYVANWPKARIEAWDTLLKARAIENMAYCIGINRVGKDALDFEYPGHSALYDPLGKLCSSLEHEKPGIEICELNKSAISEPREKLKFLQDRDHFTLEV